MGNDLDQLILVDIFDRPLGEAGKREVHENGLLHRAFSVFLCNKEGSRLLLQKRAAGKYHSGGLWANTCCSHPRPGEDTYLAARRRLAEETGISCPLTEKFSFVYRKVFADGLIEYEFDHVFVGYLSEGETKFQPDPEEIAELAWISADALALDLRCNPDRYAAWFLIAAPQVLREGKGR